MNDRYLETSFFHTAQSSLKKDGHSKIAHRPRYSLVPIPLDQVAPGQVAALKRVFCSLKAAPREIDTHSLTGLLRAIC